MKQLAAVLGFLSLAAASAAPAHAASAKADPSQYTIVAHVSASEMDTIAGTPVMTLTVTIDGKHFLLRGFPISHSLLDPGDYHARLITDLHKTSFLSSQEYEFLLPDGTTWRCGLAGQSE
ncbi:MAG: hypothetical protein WCF30_14025 [Terracidiphilus sp.]